MAAFIFDIDGTIIDSMRFHERSWDVFLTRRGVPTVGEDFFRRTAGRTGVEVMRELPLFEDETDRLLDLLARKPGDLRNGALARLRTLRDADLLGAVDRLLGDASDLRRLAGLELLRDAHEARRMPAGIMFSILVRKPAPTIWKSCVLQPASASARNRSATVIIIWRGSSPFCCL